MASNGQFINPASKNVSKRQQNSSIRDTFPIFIGEVIDVAYVPSKSGVIKFRSGHTSKVPVEQITAEAFPLFSNIKVYPVSGELVLIFYFGNAYYLPLNFLNNVDTNITPFKFQKTLTEQEEEFANIHLANLTFDLEPASTIPTSMNEGDIVFEGRFGQSLKFGSTVKFKQTPQTLYSISDLSENGDPITIIRNGIASTSEDIQKDGANIYLCSTQRIQVDNNDNGFAGITDSWSTLNINSEEYDSILIDTAKSEPDDEQSQFQITPANTATNATINSSAEITPAGTDVSTLEKLPGTYMSYVNGKEDGLVTLYVIDGVPVTNKVANSYLSMKESASKAGVTLMLNSGFRASEDITMPSGRVMKGQKTLRAAYDNGTGNLAARDGYSNHQNGSALDIDISNSNTYKWLVQNAIKFGFIRGVEKERWHWELNNSATSIYAKVARSSPTWDGYNDGIV